MLFSTPVLRYVCVCVYVYMCDVYMQVFMNVGLYIIHIDIAQAS